MGINDRGEWEQDETTWTNGKNDRGEWDQDETVTWTKSYTTGANGNRMKRHGRLGINDMNEWE